LGQGPSDGYQRNPDDRHDGHRLTYDRAYWTSTVEIDTGVNMNKTIGAVVMVVAMGVGTAATAAKSMRSVEDDGLRPNAKAVKNVQRRPQRVAPSPVAPRQNEVKKEAAPEKPSSRLDRRHA
jgi:hypothetical protein